MLLLNDDIAKSQNRFFEGEARKILRTELLKISSFFEMKSHADRTLWQSLNYLPYGLKKR